jgi:hypothetical protein
MNEELGLGPHNFQKRNTYIGFSVQCNTNLIKTFSRFLQVIFRTTSLHLEVYLPSGGRFSLVKERVNIVYVKKAIIGKFQKILNNRYHI